MNIAASAVPPAVEPALEPHGSGLVRVGDLWNLWHSIRIATSVALISCGVVLGIAWEWSNSFVVAAFAAVTLVDAIIRRRLGPGTGLPSALLDITLIGVGMAVIGLEPAGVGAPLLYILAVVLVLLPRQRALPAIAYAATWTVIALARPFLVETSIDAPMWLVTMLAYLVFGGSTVVLIAVISSRLEQSHRQRDRRLRYEHALAVCGTALLETADDRAIDVALQALLPATPAQNIFVDENSDDPILGLCATVTHEAIRPGYEDIVDEEIWVEEDDPDRVLRTVVRYADLPTLRHRLSLGHPSIIHTADLKGREREVYDDDGCLSELNIPIFVDGSWAGSIGFADYLRDRDWKEDDVAVLQTTAAMIGSFWERARAMERLEEVIHSKNQFLASISHEIRTPLTAVLGFSEVLRDDATELSPGGAEMIEIVARQAQEISDIVEDLLVAARADIDALTVTHEPVALRREAVAVASARSELKISIEESDVVALGDSVRVRQVIRCLVSNAARYGGDHIEIRFGSEDDRATVCVADDGSGVAAGHERHIFDAFHRVVEKSGITQAIGLGLYVSHHLARLMGGDLTYRRERGWTLFELELPCVSRAPDDVHDATQAGAVAAGPIALAGGALVQST